MTPSQNRLEAAFIARLLHNLPDAIRPLLLTDRGFGRASLLGWLQEMPRHTDRTCVRSGHYAFLPGAQMGW